MPFQDCSLGAALALGKLSALSTRVDPLVGDLLTSLQVILVSFVILCYLILWDLDFNSCDIFYQASDGGVRDAILTALKGVLKHSGKSVSSTFRTRVYTVLQDLICNDEDQIRASASSMLGIISQVCAI